jgi:type IX secretion system PorP/SprF family membrane protein
VISKRNIVLVFGLALCFVLRGQDFHFSGFMQNLVYINPGYTALPSSVGAGLVYRNQWPGIPATFVTYGASLVLPVSSLHSGIGIIVTNDVQGGGVISQTAAGLNYGYLIELGRHWQVGAGLNASWVIRQFNADELVLRSDLLNDLGYSYGSIPYDSYNRSYPDFSVGVVVRNELITFGISTSHLTRPVDTHSTLVESRLPMKYTAFVSGKIGSQGNRYNDISFEPAAFYSLQKTNQELIWGTRINFSSKFMLGGWLRQNLNFNFDALIVSAGISWEKYNIGYHYDVNLKKISFLSTKMAAHEVTFLYRFEYKDQHKVKRFKKSECPAY